MDNDTLINQARQLYTLLSVEQYARSFNNNTRFVRLEHLVTHAYCRYQRRLNRCVLCYQHRLTDCDRVFKKNRLKLCPALIKQLHKPARTAQDASD